MPNFLRNSTEKQLDIVDRCIWLGLSLRRDRTVSYERYLDRTGRSQRSYLRDLQRLRKLGVESKTLDSYRVALFVEKA